MALVAMFVPEMYQPLQLAGVAAPVVIEVEPPEPVAVVEKTLGTGMIG